MGWDEMENLMLKFFSGVECILTGFWSIEQRESFGE